MRHAALGLIVLIGMLAACSINKERTLAAREGAEDPAALAARAESLFTASPRTPARAANAFRTMQEAARTSAPDDPARFRYLTDAAQYAVWAASHTDDVDQQEALADAAITLSNTAIQMDSSRVEGYFYRAAAIGLFIQENKLKGRSGMTDIRADAQRAIELDSTYSDGGPYRILGTLYLRAPGPPTGIGSTRRALRTLQQAYEVAPEHPANVLRLAEAHLEVGNPEAAAALLDDLDEVLTAYDAPALTKEDWEAEAAELRRRLPASSSHDSGPSYPHRSTKAPHSA